MSSDSALAALEAVVTNAIAIIAQLEAAAASVDSQNPSENGNAGQDKGPSTLEGDSLDVLSLAHDSVTLIKAHSTKISLLIINEPFTATAITKVVRELLAGPLPALASAIQLCNADRYTQTIQQDLAWRGGRVFSELRELLLRVPKDGNILSDEKKNASAGAAAGKGSLATTGVLWAACDDIISFSKRGFAGNLVHKVEQFRDTLKDVMEELKEWGEETEEDDEDEDSAREEDGLEQVTQELKDSQLSATDHTQAMLDDWMNSQQHIPRDDPDNIRERLEACLRRLRLTTLLYQATVKRRLKPLAQLPPDPSSKIPGRLDEVMVLLKRIPDRFSNLALAFYELDPIEIDRLMDQCFFDAFAVSELLANRWDGGKDEFTDWALKFQVEIKKS